MQNVYLSASCLIIVKERFENLEIKVLAKDLTSHNVRLPDKKFTQYLLSTENKVGKNKARVFSTALGYNIIGKS